MNNRDLAFTHRPLTGVSVGAYNANGVLYVAAAFTNDGTSRNGNYHEEHNDVFSRAISRRIIAGRITFSQKIATRFVFEVETDMTGPDFMRAFRQSFKPELDETDNVLHDAFVQGGTEYRARKTVNDIWDVIGDLANIVVNAPVAVGTETTGN